MHCSFPETSPSGNVSKIYLEGTRKEEASSLWGKTHCTSSSTPSRRSHFSVPHNRIGCGRKHTCLRHSDREPLLSLPTRSSCLSQTKGPLVHLGTIRLCRDKGHPGFHMCSVKFQLHQKWHSHRSQQPISKVPVIPLRTDRQREAHGDPVPRVPLIKGCARPLFLPGPLPPS